MIIGAVNADIEAIIEVVVVGANGRQRVDAVIDTGFSGDLTLPEALIASLQLTWLGREAGILADGRTELFDVYSAILIWDGQERAIEVEATNTQPLIGMNLLHRYSVYIEVVNGGPVRVSSLPR